MHKIILLKNKNMNNKKEQTAKIGIHTHRLIRTLVTHGTNIALLAFTFI